MRGHKAAQCLAIFVVDRADLVRTEVANLLYYRLVVIILVIVVSHNLNLKRNVFYTDVFAASLDHW